MWKIYTRPGCHLCEDALEWLQELTDEQQTTLQNINILDDYATYELYKWSIPVLIIGDQTWHAPLEEQQIRHALAQTTP